MTYTAVWEEILPTTYQITFDANGGIGGEVQTVEEGSMPVAPFVIRDGYIFVEWTPEIVAATGDATYTAVWEEIIVETSTITFDTDGGSLIDPITGEVGTAVTAPADPTKAGYTFFGWSQAIPAAFPAEDVTITALWYMLGDVNGDGQVSALDALMTLQASTGETTLTPIQAAAADVNKDGRLSSLDALMILHFASGKLTSFPEPAV